MTNLRLRLAATVLLASVACALIAALLIGTVAIHQQKRFEAQRITEAYSVATTDLFLGDSVNLNNGTPLLSLNASKTVDELCQATRVGIAFVPSYATINPSTGKTSFNTDARPIALSQQTSKFAIGAQNSLDISRLATSPQTTQICGNKISNSKIAYLEPLPGSSLSSVDILLIGTSPSWLSLVKDIGVGTIALFISVLIIAAIALKFVLKHLRMATLGYTPIQLAAILEEQETMLQGISEGVAGCDPSGKIRFFNSEAKRILNLPNQSIARPINVLVRGARLRQVLSGEISGRDLPVVVGDSVVIVNRIQVNRGDENLGYVITLRDQTEWEGLLKELDSLVGMTNALRAQAHEFSNKIHTIIGLIEIGQPAEAVAFATEISLTHSSVSKRLRETIGDPMISAMLLAKSAAASERAVDLIIEEESSINGQINSPSEILSLLGNLVDNAIDSASSSVMQLGWKNSDRGWVRVMINDFEGELHIEVTDSGPGIPDSVLPDIFTDGFSTKDSRYGARRGLGLALVKQVVTHCGGSVKVTNQPGAHFEIVLPGAVRSNELNTSEKLKVLSSEKSEHK